MDMSPVYRKGAREHLPDAEITFDRFPVLKPLNEPVDQVRRAERKDAPELTCTRYLWLENQSNPSRRQQRQPEHLLLASVHLKTVVAYQMKLAFPFETASSLTPGLSECRAGLCGPRRLGPPSSP